jgi:hypothetical protein
MSTREPSITVEIHRGKVCLVGPGDDDERVVTPRLLRDLAEATAAVCGWPDRPGRCRSIPSRHGGQSAVSFVQSGVEHIVPIGYARALAVALLIAADEAEATP